MSKLHELLGNDEVLFKEEALIVDVTERLLNLMESEGVSKKQLAGRLGRSKAFVTRLLNGDHNMTLRTLARVAHELNVSPSFDLKIPLKFAPGHSYLGVEANERVVADYSQLRVRGRFARNPLPAGYPAANQASFIESSPNERKLGVGCG